MPNDIAPPSGLNIIAGLCFLALTAIPGVPIAMEIYYDGFDVIWDWAPLFNWFTLIAAVLLAVSVHAFAFSPPLGAHIRFRGGRIKVEIQMLARKRQVHDFDWAEVDRVEVVQAGRNSYIAICPNHGPIASVPMRFMGVSADDALKRFRASAEAAGFSLSRTKAINLLLFSREVWQVQPAANTGQ